MQCANCNVEISAAFKFAFVKNECPACGSKILDSDSIELIRNVKELISSEIEITEDASHNLAMLIVSNFSVSFKSGKVAKSSPGVKLYKPPSQKFITASEVSGDGGISQEERDKIMEEVVRAKYNLTDQAIMAVDEDDFGANLVDIDPSEVFGQTKNKDIGLPASEFDVNPALEQGRINKLAYQRAAVEGGKPSAVRRG
jgi:hypothetical protein